MNLAKLLKVNADRCIPFVLLILILCAAILAPETVRAATITIDDSNPNDTITYTWANFLSFSFNGQAQDPRGGSITISEANAVSSSGTWIDNSGATIRTGDRTIYFVEASKPTQVSDIIFSTTSLQNVDGNRVVTLSSTFTSDLNDDLGDLPAGVNPAFVGVESAQPVILTIGNPANPNFIATLKFDVDPVPETGPGAVGLLTILGLCVVGSRQRLSRRPMEGSV